MNGKVFFDTNVLVYAFAIQLSNRADPRVAKAEELLSLGGTVSIQVLNEFADVATRKLNFTWEAVETGLGAIAALCGPPIPLDVATHLRAVYFSKRYGYRIYDSMILASAERAGCTAVYTEDLHHGQTIGKLQVVNPFRDLVF